MDAQLIFTASRYDQQRLKKGLAKFTDLGGRILNPSASLSPHHFYCGGTSSRLESVLCGLKHDGPLLLMPPRGGYGTAELLDDLPHQLVTWLGKTLIGFSDLTAFHSFLSNLGVPSIHGPMLGTQGWLDASPEETDSLLCAITGQPQKLTIHYDGPDHTGRSVGGNLTVLASLMGTPHQLQLKPGDILFLEDINEPHYSLARSLFQISHSPHFKDCTLLWGHLSGQDLPIPTLIERLMEAHPNNFWGYGVPAGHAAPNFSLPLGQPARMSVHRLFVSMNP